MNGINFRDFEMILTEMESLFFCLIKRTKNQGWSKLWFRGYDLWMKLIFVDFKKIFTEMKSLFFSLMKRTKNQGRRRLWIRGYDLWMKLIFVNFKKIFTEMKSLFFCLIKRTKNQGFGMVVKAQYSDFLKIIAPSALFCSLLKGWFCRWFLRSFQQKSSFSPFQNYSLIVESKI